MIRRTARLRREYLYRKGLEGKEKVQYEKKRVLKKALEGTHEVPHPQRNHLNRCGGN
jgi:U3 small nucleolar ribonucleoprotein protein IMP4